MKVPPLFKGALADRHPRPAPPVRPAWRAPDPFEAEFRRLLAEMREPMSHVAVFKRGDGRTAWADLEGIR